MRPRPIIDTRMLGALNNFYVSVCTIQSSTEESSSFGSPTDLWDPVEALSGIPCSVSAVGARPTDDETRAATLTYATTTVHISMQGSYPAITTEMRAVVRDWNNNEQAYDIIGVDNDSHGKTTRLLANKVEI